MKSKKAILISMGFLSAFLACGQVSAASYCRDKVSDVIDKLASNICDSIDTKVLTEEQAASTPYGYTSPDSGCDIGLSMPGLPGFGLDISGIDSCAILKAVTGDMVDKANDTMQGSLDTALEKIKGDTSIPSKINTSEIISDQIKNNTGL